MTTLVLTRTRPSHLRQRQAVLMETGPAVKGQSWLVIWSGSLASQTDASLEMLDDVFALKEIQDLLQVVKFSLA